MGVKVESLRVKVESLGVKFRRFFQAGMEGFSCNPSRAPGLGIVLGVLARAGTASTAGKCSWLSKQCWRAVTRQGSGRGDRSQAQGWAGLSHLVGGDTSQWLSCHPLARWGHIPVAEPSPLARWGHIPVPASQTSRDFPPRPILCLASLTQCQGCSGTLPGAATPLSPQRHQIPNRDKALIPSLPQGIFFPPWETKPRPGTGDDAPGGESRLLPVLLAQSSLICSRLSCSAWKRSSRSRKSAEPSSRRTQPPFHNPRHRWGCGGRAGTRHSGDRWRWKSSWSSSRIAGAPWQGSPCPRDTQPCPCQARSSFTGSGEEPSRPLTRRRLEKGSSYFASWL